MYPLKTSEEVSVREFLNYWNQERSEEVKRDKWLSFIGYWKYALEVASSIVDFDLYKSEYKYYVTDNADYGGSVSCNLEIYIPSVFFDDLGLEPYQKYDAIFDLNEILMESIIDKYYKEESIEFYMFRVTFKLKED